MAIAASQSLSGNNSELFNKILDRAQATPEERTALTGATPTKAPRTALAAGAGLGIGAAIGGGITTGLTFWGKAGWPMIKTSAPALSTSAALMIGGGAAAGIGLLNSIRSCTKKFNPQFQGADKFIAQLKNGNIIYDEKSKDFKPKPGLETYNDMVLYNKWFGLGKRLGFGTTQGGLLKRINADLKVNQTMPSADRRALAFETLGNKLATDMRISNYRKGVTSLVAYSAAGGLLAGGLSGGMATAVGILSGIVVGALSLGGAKFAVDNQIAGMKAEIKKIQNEVPNQLASQSIIKPLDQFVNNQELTLKTTLKSLNTTDLKNTGKGDVKNTIKEKLKTTDNAIKDLQAVKEFVANGSLDALSDQNNDHKSRIESLIQDQKIPGDISKLSQDWKDAYVERINEKLENVSLKLAQKIVSSLTFGADNSLKLAQKDKLTASSLNHTAGLAYIAARLTCNDNSDKIMINDALEKFKTVFTPYTQDQKDLSAEQVNILNELGPDSQGLLKVAIKMLSSASDQAKVNLVPVTDVLESLSDLVRLISESTNKYGPTSTNGHTARPENNESGSLSRSDESEASPSRKDFPANPISPDSSGELFEMNQGEF